MITQYWWRRCGVCTFETVPPGKLMARRLNSNFLRLVAVVATRRWLRPTTGPDRNYYGRERFVKTARSLLPLEGSELIKNPRRI